MVSQRPYLFSGALAEKVSLAIAERTDLVQAVNCREISGPQSFASPKGLQMEVHPDSGRLSGAEI
jgi:ABC-type transport system involved in cytochrome bd biosynthesis fused ATPase/permease subunit